MPSMTIEDQHADRPSPRVVSVKTADWERVMFPIRWIVAGDAVRCLASNLKDKSWGIWLDAIRLSLADITQLDDLPMVFKRTPA